MKICIGFNCFVFLLPVLHCPSTCCTADPFGPSYTTSLHSGPQRLIHTTERTRKYYLPTSVLPACSRNCLYSLSSTQPNNAHAGVGELHVISASGCHLLLYGLISARSKYARGITPNLSTDIRTVTAISCTVEVGG